ncbi:MAG: hypothetical protein PF541_11675 [Prolixibacteraceae bacterium]|jgi:hypothetical protein|nr:hypothetical protein [Prolixibacteraceae bacterium]
MILKPNLLFFVFAIVVSLSSCNKTDLPTEYATSETTPQIFPDYDGVTIPLNIAPLNFMIEEPGDNYIVQVSSTKGNPILIESSSSSIQINQKKWKKLVQNNKGETMLIEVFVLQNDTWSRFSAIEQFIANESIDSYLTYRLINSGYILWNEMGIYQRDLESFKESPIVKNTSIDKGCVNCHIACNNDPEKSLFHVRAAYSGTLMLKDGKLEKLDTKTDFTMSSAVYPSWHPDGRFIAFSVNKINQQFYSLKGKSIEVSDKYSDLIVYDSETKIVTTSPKVSTNNRENLPEWSADGKSIYYISAPPASDETDRILARYSLVNIPYDVEENKWGEVDTLISAYEVQKSITFPRISPDGNFLVFNMTDYGYFTIHHKISDLYIMDLKTKKYRIASELNSNETESYHSWSSNGRWLIFSSRRIDGIHTRTFIAHIAEDGTCGKPFVVPQKDPDFYRNCLLNFNRPELLTGKLKVSPQTIRNAIYKDPEKVKFDTMVHVNALSGATKMGHH